MNHPTRMACLPDRREQRIPTRLLWADVFWPTLRRLLHRHRQCERLGSFLFLSGRCPAQADAANSLQERSSTTGGGCLAEPRDSAERTRRIPPQDPLKKRRGSLWPVAFVPQSSRNRWLQRTSRTERW